MKSLKERIQEFEDFLDTLDNQYPSAKGEYETAKAFINRWEKPNIFYIKIDEEAPLVIRIVVENKAKELGFL